VAQPRPRRFVSRHSLRYLLPGAAVIVVIGGGAFAALETDTVESFWEGAWWALSLMTTVGFVGGTPHTAAGRVVSAVLMVLGFGLLAMTTAAIASLFVREDEEAEAQREGVFEHELLEELREVRAQLDEIRVQMNLGPHRDSLHTSSKRLPDE
jgi:voltage-gated potassium channel